MLADEQVKPRADDALEHCLKGPCWGPSLGPRSGSETLLDDLVESCGTTHPVRRPRDATADGLVFQNLRPELCELFHRTPQVPHYRTALTDLVRMEISQDKLQIGLVSMAESPTVPIHAAPREFYGELYLQPPRLIPLML